ncbi:hypothetical protein IP84_12720 [beta proteobacterium AAP99]|nr:hypothetical protein IP84_12720 [beta proteobacterium AAP99]
MGFARDGRERLVAIAKATYTLPISDEPPVLLEVQQPLIAEDTFSGEPGQSSPLKETDYAHLKLRCDVVLVGSAYAPGGYPCKTCEVGLQVGRMIKRFRIVGDRRWAESMLTLRSTDPSPFVRMPISYDNAFGGVDRTHEADGKTATFLRNPVGRGFAKHRQAVDGAALPNTEQLGQAVGDPAGEYVPQAFSPIGRSWWPRANFAGTYDQAWIETKAPLWPDDFDERYFQCTPEDQQIDPPVGGETIFLLNLTADGQRRFALPALQMPMTVIPTRGRDLTRHATVDTLVLEPDEGRFTVTWRMVVPMPRSIFDVRELVIGEMSAAWHRARRFPGKKYYANLDEAYRDRRTRGGQ